MRQGLREDRSAIDTFPIGINKDLGGDSLNEISQSIHENYTSQLAQLMTDDEFNQTTPKRDALYIVVPITIIYFAIFLSGLIGNVSTCVVIARNRSMHTATNYYLFSLAVSDLLLLVSGLPPEMYYIWSHFPYIFGEIFCIIQSFAAETSANATVLTITAFTVERYVAICHPFRSRTIPQLSRVVKYIIVIWVLALCLAIPQAIQFGITFSKTLNGTIIPDTATCSVKWVIIKHAFEISTILFFVVPMTIITVLYGLIGIKLISSRMPGADKRKRPEQSNSQDSSRSGVPNEKNVLRMLVAVVVAFFICWAPFHAQRLLAVYAKSLGDGGSSLVTVYTTLTYISGIFYYLSTTINPLLYNIMSNRFREAFKRMLAEHCGGRRSIEPASPRKRTYSDLSHGRGPVGKRPEQNSGSFSASDETQHLTPLVRNDEIEQASSHQESSVLIAKDSIGRKQLSSDVTPKSRSNDSSDSSQIIIVTSLAKGLDEACHNKGGLSHSTVNKCLKVQRPIKAVTLGLLAERLRSGTKGLFAHQQRQTRSSKMRVDSTIQRVQQKMQSHPSIESANTISNSSLQDLDETEFTGSELAKYMGEINFELVT